MSVVRFKRLTIRSAAEHLSLSRTHVDKETAVQFKCNERHTFLKFIFMQRYL